MQVITLHPEEFEAHARALAEMVAHDYPGAFDGIVGIRNGGSIVCDAFCRHFPKDKWVYRSDIHLQRPSSKKKQGVVAKILKLLPIPLLNLMRMAESRILEFLGKQDSGHEPTVQIDEKLYQFLSAKTSPEILLIDDAIDSGTTLKTIVNALKIVNPNVKILTAVSPVTTPYPRANANYTLYRNRTLIRFPWSHDYKSL